MCIALRKVIALPTIAIALVVRLLKALAKSNGNLFSIAFKREKERKAIAIARAITLENASREEAKN